MGRVFHNVPPRRQPATWACWYTSYQMVVSYYRDQSLGRLLRDPSEDRETQGLYTSNQGVSDPVAIYGTERERIAKKLGFSVLYASMTQQGMEDLLSHSPVIYDGYWPSNPSTAHAIVIIGIDGDTLTINDPADGRRHTFNYNQFMGQYLLNFGEAPLIYVERP